ncbi:MAG TPA: DUF6502 family protein [Steroidobacteraceae bacterium]|nr:DUF6502 family protein [Steroidobacteraceae bacterium]
MSFLVSTEKEKKVEGEAFLDAIEALLRPLMPVVLSYGVTAQDIGEVFRTLYLETLTEKLREQGRPATAPRLALMAGLNRGEVDALLSRRAVKRRLRARSSRKLDELTRVLSTWHDDTKFSTPYGAPLDLSLRPERGFKTFNELVEAAGASSDVGLILDELLAAGCVEVHVEKFIRCVSRVFIPAGVDSFQIARMGRYVGALIDTFVYNLMRKADQPSYYEVVVSTSGPVKREFRDAILKYIHTRLQPVLEDMDRWLESHEVEFRDTRGVRFGLGTFFFEEARNESEIEGKQIANAS